MSALDAVDSWEVPHVAVAVVGADGAVLETRGPIDRPFRLASVSKLLTTYALLVGVQGGTIALDDAAGPRGSTVRHLLAHASGLGFEAGDPVRAAPGARRIYSNAGIEAAAEHLADVTSVGFETYLTEAVLTPLGMTSSSLYGSPAHDVHGPVCDLVAFAAELFAPRLLPPAAVGAALEVQFPGLAGFVPGVGRFDPCDWGLGFERNFGRPTHWAGARTSPEAFGHFGAAGTFFWVDPVAGVACICLTDRPFDAWAMAAWPPLCDSVISAYGPGVAAST